MNAPVVVMLVWALSSSGGHTASVAQVGAMTMEACMTALHAWMNESPTHRGMCLDQTTGYTRKWDMKDIWKNAS